MNPETLQDEAKKMFLADYANELRKNGILRPTKNKDPIFPPWDEAEYEAMEKDTAKYFLYYAAIYMGLKSREKKNDVNVMVIGAGRGRLVEYCVDCMKENEIFGTVHVIEANQQAHVLLKEKFARTLNVIVYQPVAVRTSNEFKQLIESPGGDKRLLHLVGNKCVDVFVSELFGSFADNEFVGEILSTCVDLFARVHNGNPTFLSIPECFATYVCAIHSDTLQNAIDSDSVEHIYVAGLPKDTVFLSEITKVFDQLCTEAIPEQRHKITLKRLDSQSLSVTAVAGYFKARLFGEIYIDTRPTANQNCFFWESAIFPVADKESINSEIMFTLSRTCQNITNSRHHTTVKYPKLKMWYEWGINNQTYNLKGSSHMLFL